jgi:DNA-binding response OmpR family regulator
VPLIRERSNAYVLVLTGRDDEVDKLLGFRWAPTTT